MSEQLHDSGTRREFETGAHRDMASGKGDMYSLPASAILRISKHYELGAKKYNRLNYQKGIPITAFMDSALRHLFKYLAGMDDEDHLSAAAFNVLGAIEMECNHPDMQDVEARKGKNTFPYAESPATPAPDKPEPRTCGNCRYIANGEFGVRLCTNDAPPYMRVNGDRHACDFWQAKEVQS